MKEMGLNFINNIRSPNFGTNEIPVEFLILHYTACDIARTLEIFSDPNKKVSAHFVIDLNGDVYYLGGFHGGPILQAAHAGVSRLEFQGSIVEKFNTNSIGIELVNLNGNVFPYTDEQYEALTLVIAHLKTRFRALRDPQRVLGHEQIAGFRGKADPGTKFDWPRLFRDAYAGAPVPERKAVCTVDEIKHLLMQIQSASSQEKSNPLYWTALSAGLEQALRMRLGTS